MANYGDVQRSFTAFESAIALLNKLRTELENEGYDKELPKWFVVSDGNKPWNFCVDWLGVTYHLAISTDVDTEQGRFLLKNAKLTVGRLSDGALQNPSVTVISEAKVNIRRGSIHFEMDKSRENGEKVFPHEAAAGLFLAMIGQPAEF